MIRLTFYIFERFTYALESDDVLSPAHEESGAEDDEQNE